MQALGQGCVHSWHPLTIMQAFVWSINSTFKIFHTASGRFAALINLRRATFPSLTVTKHNLNFFRGISVIGGFKLTLYRKLWERCAHLSYAATASDKDGMLMIYQGHLLMEAVAPILAGSMPKPVWLLPHAKQYWKAQIGEGIISAFQQEVSDHLSDTGIEHRLEERTFDNMLASDVSLMSRGVALECDGPSHFCINSGTGSVPLSRNGVRDTLLCTRGWQVVSVPWDEWSVQKINGKCRLWIEQSLSRLSGSLLAS